MNDNDDKQPPIERTDREQSETDDYKRIMKQVLIPKLQQMFSQIREFGLDDPSTPVKTWAPVAATYRLWSEEATRELTAHYHKFIAPLTVKGREEEAFDEPHAVRDFVEEISGWTAQEQIAQFIQEQQPPLDLPQMRAMHTAFDEVKRRATEINTAGVTAFPGKAR